MRSLEKLWEFYSMRLPETMKIAAWSGKLLVARLALLQPIFEGRKYAEVAHDLFTDCRAGTDHLTNVAFDPPEYAQKVGQFQTVYRLEAVRGFCYAYGNLFAYDAQQYFWQTPVSTEPTCPEFFIASPDVPE